MIKILLWVLTQSPKLKRMPVNTFLCILQVMKHEEIKLKNSRYKKYVLHCIEAMTVSFLDRLPSQVVSQKTVSRKSTQLPFLGSQLQFYGTSPENHFHETSC